MAAGTTSRRRGDRLIESIYDAAIEIIRDEGYSNLTFLRVARVARTGRAVLYRRWATPFDLTREIMEHTSAQALGGDLIDLVADTGSLRTDLLHLMDLYQTIFTSTGPEIMNAMLFEMSQNNARIPVIKGDIAFRNAAIMEKILGYAAARGESVTPVTDIAMTLPFDLMRANFLWNQRPLDEDLRQRLVDEILLPVYTARPVSEDQPPHGAPGA
ncbi:MAG: TetR/AcrR family transcriptional regulator [Propionibacteriaceae bacterium]|nr:TetR/AcrR family transcriptional regulator [Propionibacteriaceae bacterium]